MVEAISNTMNTPNVQGIKALSKRFDEVEAKQGLFGSVWNSFKEATGTGVSKKDCQNMLLKYQRGEVSLNQAIEYINSFDSKQSEMADLGANILTGVGAIALATCMVTGPIGWVAALTFGAPVGALLKTGIKLLDRASNDVKGDEFDGKQMAKDFISGAVTGMTSAVWSGVGEGIKAGKIALSVSNGAKSGAECGAIAGASSYITDVALDNDKYFKFGDLVKTTATSAFVSGTVGAAVGAGMYQLSNNVGKEVEKSVTDIVKQDAAASSARKVLATGERTVAELV